MMVWQRARISSHLVDHERLLFLVFLFVLVVYFSGDEECEDQSYIVSYYVDHEEHAPC